MIDRSLSPHRGRARTVAAGILLSCMLALLLTGCAAESVSSQRFTDIVLQYPATGEPLAVPRLTSSAADALRGVARGADVIVIVHPAYSLFFRDEHKSRYSDAKYELLKLQLENEQRFIARAAAGATPVILVLPGNHDREGVAPRSYTAYLNLAAGSSRMVYQVTSETTSSGVLPTDTLVGLYGFLRKFGAGKVLIGGGFVGRCQREFYSQLISYFDNVNAYIVPELSTISPDDISTEEAREILVSVFQNDFTPVRSMIEQKTYGAAVLSIPSAPER